MICTRQLFKTLASSLSQSYYFLSFIRTLMSCQTSLNFVLLIPTFSSVADRKPTLNFLKHLCFIKSYFFSKRFMGFLCIFSYELKTFLYIFFLVYSKTSIFSTSSKRCFPILMVALFKQVLSLWEFCWNSDTFSETRVFSFKLKFILLSNWYLITLVWSVIFYTGIFSTLKDKHQRGV